VEPSGDKKDFTKENMRSFYVAIDLSWVMRGDFNKILYGAKKQG
jgi:hypothetical protein